MFDNLADLDPLIQLFAIAGFIGFVVIAGFKTWRYVQKRLRRGRSKGIWF